MELTIYNINGEAMVKVTLDDSIFEINQRTVIWLDVKQYLANQRQGTHKTKERNEVAGSSRIIRQKGSGCPRGTSSRLAGGGRAFGPRPRDYGFKVNTRC